MLTEIKIPVPDQVTEEVRVLKWLKNVGDTVKRAEVILEIETEKSAIEVEAMADGVILEMSAQEGEMVSVGKVVGYIGRPGEKPNAEDVSVSDVPAVLASETISSNPVLHVLDVKLPNQRKAVSPNALRLAKELGVDVDQITIGTGQDGRIVGEDVKQFAMLQSQQVAEISPQNQSPKAGIEISINKMRRAIGTNLLRSWQQSPHFNVTMSIIMTRAMNFREQYNCNRPKQQQLSVNDLVVKACAMKLRQYPSVNSKLAEDKIIYPSNVNIGIATALPEGLVVPVLVDADRLNWDQVQTQTKRMVAEARSGKIIGMGKGTFTISNLGMFGVDNFTAIINPPECAILAVGAVVDTVVAINKMITVLPMMQVTLCSDHRIIDGATAAQFLKSLKEYLEEEIG